MSQGADDIDAVVEGEESEEDILPSFSFTRPLSWEEARRKLREVLEDYLETPIAATSERSEDEAWWLRWDMDLYLGALAASLALLILSSTSLASKKQGKESALNVAAETSVYASQVAASVLLTTGALFSIFLVRRRRYTCCRDTDVAKRRTISKFLSKSNDHEGDTNLEKEDQMEIPETTSGQLDAHGLLGLSGTSLSDIYPVYRRAANGEPQWQNVSTLLLVAGDFISLQVGDVAPGACRMMDFDSSGSLVASQIVHSGERITPVSFEGVQRTFSSSFPKGKSSVKPESRELLTLCNRMRVCRLEETPLHRFLRLPQMKQRTPQLHRQIYAIRRVMFMFAVAVFTLTLAIIFVRPDVMSSDLSLLLPAPFLAALGVLPVLTPACGFFLEVVGTARILVAVHPHATIRAEHIQRKSLLFLRYALATSTSRLSLQEPMRRLSYLLFRIVKCLSPKKDASSILSMELLHVPPASNCLLEKLGVTTAIALVDDELVCEACSAPQQLMIPSGKGLKLLDLCQTYEIDSDEDSDSDTLPPRRRTRSDGSSQRDSDSDSDNEIRAPVVLGPRKKLKAFRKRHRKRVDSVQGEGSSAQSESDNRAIEEIEVQFEDPIWWQHLPSLKCIGLACLVADSDPEGASLNRLESSFSNSDNKEMTADAEHCLLNSEKSLVGHISSERQRRHLHALAHCIGFSTESNSFGERGDLSVFSESLRLHIFSTELHMERLSMDAHALGLEESRSWGLLRPDSTSIVVQDRRSKAYQLLTVGDPRIVTGLCREAWQGENSTIFPLNVTDRNSIVDTSTNWVLSDLDVTAFSYAPVPHTFEHKLLSRDKGTPNAVYLVDNFSNSLKDKASEDWALVKDQIFLGVLGSCVVPRKDMEKLFSSFNDSGVRFVYFSPRNMRRTKELASQMGIDVAWNCAISLRPLDEGEEDPHRMVSAYADWDVNARLPHGIDNVRIHLEEVDNVPLLVSLFTDVTKDSTKEMLATFQNYSDSVLVMGLSHVARNSEIFSTADVSVGADVLMDELGKAEGIQGASDSTNAMLPHEVGFVSSIAAHACVFNLCGATSPSQMPEIIECGRAALEATKSAALFLIFGSVTFSLFVLLCMCSASTTIPFVPSLGSALYLQVILPIIGLAMASREADADSMKRVPEKNDQSIVFQKKQGSRLYMNIFLKGLLPAALPQILHLIALGELILAFEPQLVVNECSIAPEDIGKSDWTDVIRCDGLKNYSGDARISAGALVLAVMVICVIVTSASCVHPTTPILQESPWTNHLWICSVFVSIVCVAVYLVASLQEGTVSALPWYFFFLVAIMPILCLLGHELIKRSECRHAKRASMLRRLQFETRLGMWSPK